jgi:hypothetical protein
MILRYVRVWWDASYGLFWDSNGNPWSIADVARETRR